MGSKETLLAWDRRGVIQQERAVGGQSQGQREREPVTRRTLETAQLRQAH